MYIPKAFIWKDREKQIALMKRYPFATIVSAGHLAPIATHLPFVIEEQSDRLVLIAHFARNNEQLAYLEAHPALVIFSMPHAYISPRHYDQSASVPTWDYLAIHAYGSVKILHDEQSKAKALEQMITCYEPDYLNQWNTLSEKFKTGMRSALVAFELEVTDLQGQLKLSQNKTEQERERIIRYLENGDCIAKDLAAYMRDKLI